MQAIEYFAHRTRVTDQAALGQLELQRLRRDVRLAQHLSDIGAELGIAQCGRTQVDAEVEVAIARQSLAPLAGEFACTRNRPPRDRYDQSRFFCDAEEFIRGEQSFDRMLPAQ